MVNSSGVVTSIIITNAGSGYTSVPIGHDRRPAAARRHGHGDDRLGRVGLHHGADRHDRQPRDGAGALHVNYSSPGTTGTLTFTPVAGVSDTATITVTVTDQGSNSNGSVNFTQQSFVVAVAPSHFPPVLTPATGGTLTFFQGQAATPIAPSLTVTDTQNSPPDTTIASASVAFVNNTYLPGEDVLGFSPNPQNGITGTFNAADGHPEPDRRLQPGELPGRARLGHVPGHQLQPESRGYGTGPHPDVHGQ